MGVKVDDVEVDLRARFDKLGRDLQQAEGRWKAHERSVSSSLKRAAAATAAFVGGVVAVSAAYRTLSNAGARALREAQGQEKAITLLNAQLRTSGQFSEAYSKRLQQLAGDFQRLSTTGDDVTLGLFKQLTAFGANESNIKRLTQAVLDLSAGLGTDLNAAALLVGKALSGEFGSLSRYGIIIDKNASQTEKLELALRGIEKRFGGSALAATKTFSGALEQLGNNTGDVYEELGRIVTDSAVIRGAIQGISERAADTASSIASWREANQELIDQKLDEYLGGLAAAMNSVGSAFEASAPTLFGVLDTLTQIAIAYDALPEFVKRGIEAGASGRGLAGAVGVGGSDLVTSILERLGVVAPSDTAPPTDRPRPGERRLSGGEIVLGSVEPPPPSPTGTPPPEGVGGGGSERKPADFLADVAKDQAAFLAAAESRLQNQIQLLTEAGDQTGQIAAIEAQILALRERSLQSQLALAEAQGLSAGELATLSAELENARDNIAASTGPAREVADGFVEATEAARDLGTTLRTDVLSSVKQIVVGIAQGTTDLKDFPSRFAQAATGQIVSRGFDAVLGDGGLFGSATGAGDAGSFLNKLGGAIGLSGPGGNAPPAGFTGPPVNLFGATTRGLTGALQTAGGFFAGLGPEGLITGALGIGALGGSLASKGAFGAKAEKNSSLFGLATSAALLGPFTFGLAPLGIALLGNRAPSVKERRRIGVGDSFKESNIFPTLAFAKNPPREFSDAAQPGFIGSISDEIGALSLLLGGTLEDARRRLPRTVGQRASVTGLGLDRVRKELRTVAADSGVSLDDAVFDLTDRFLRFQQEGKGSAISQREYNDLLAGTVSLFADDLPLGIDATVGALGTLERFGDQQIGNLEDLRETLADTAAAAQGFAAGVTSGIRAAIDSGDITDVSESLAKSFSSTFVDRVVADIVEGQALGESLTRAVDLQREISAAYREGNFSRAATLQGQLSDTFAQANARILTESAPIVQSIRGLQASLNVQATPGVIRQQPLIVQNIVDGRVVSEAVVSADRLNRSGGVIVPEQIGTR